MNTLNIYPLCEALATGLLHSLWLFPVLVGLDWLVTKGLSQSQHRYLSHLITLMTCLAAFLGLVGWRWWTVTRAWSDATFLQIEIGTPLTSKLTDGFQKIGLATTTDWTLYLVSAYLVGLMIVLIRYVNKYRATLLMRKGGLLPDPQYRALFAALKAEVYPRRHVGWRITDRVRNVLVVGVLRPVILFPVGLINQLTEDEVVAILRHELTHLRRYDPFWNAVQELVQTIFFYHPVIYLLCRKLDREREYACDDAVLRDTEPKLYARALLRVANYSLNPKIPLTMAAISTPDFTQRVQRLFSPAASRSALPFTRYSSWLSSLAVLPLLLLLTYAVVNPYQLTAQTAPTEEKANEIIFTGTVVDGNTGEPLIGTSIMIVDTETGTASDFDGNFKVRVPSDNRQLLVSYVGYRTLHFHMEPWSSKNVTANIKLYKDKRGKIDVDVSKAQFIYLEDSERDYGGEQAVTKVKARGTGLTLDNNDKILYLIDGKKKEDTMLETIDPEDIESINVFKGKDEIKKFGYGTKYEGVISIKMKKKDKN